MCLTILHVMFNCPKHENCNFFCIRQIAFATRCPGLMNSKVVPICATNRSVFCFWRYVSDNCLYKFHSPNIKTVLWRTILMVQHSFRVSPRSLRKVWTGDSWKLPRVVGTLSNINIGFYLFEWHFYLSVSLAISVFSPDGYVGCGDCIIVLHVNAKNWLYSSSPVMK